jgi:AAA domain
MASATHGSTKFHLLTDADIEQLPDPEWLIDGLIPLGGLAVLAGPPGIGKSFLAIDWAYSVAMGMPWQGHPTRGGHVVYVAAEGKAGLKLRQRAWKQQMGVDDCPNMRYLAQAVQLLDGESVEALVDEIYMLPATPVLIVFDTLARCFVGGEENSATFMGQLIAGADRLRGEMGATVLLIHHTGKQKSGNQMKLAARGSSALDGAAELMMRLLSTKASGLSLICDKQKDGEPFKPMSLRLKSVAVSDDQHSCVIEAAGGIGQGTEVDEAPQLDQTHIAAIEVLRRLNGQDVPSAEWLRATGLKERTFYRVARDLKDAKLVKKAGSGRDVRYSL